MCYHRFLLEGFMDELKIITEKLAEIDCLMETSEADFLFSSFSKSRAIHPRFKFLELLEKKIPEIRDGKDVSLSEDVLFNDVMNVVLKEKELLNSVNEYMDKKSFPFVVNSEMGLRLGKVVIENGFMKNITLRVPIKAKDEGLILPFSISIYEAVFSSIKRDDMTCDANLFFDKDLGFKGTFNFHTEDPEALLSQVNELNNSQYVKSFYIEKVSIMDKRLELDVIVDLNKFEEDLEDEW